MRKKETLMAGKFSLANSETTKHGLSSLTHKLRVFLTMIGWRFIRWLNQNSPPKAHFPVCIFYAVKWEGPRFFLILLFLNNRLKSISQNSDSGWQNLGSLHLALVLANKFIEIQSCPYFLHIAYDCFCTTMKEWCPD